MSEKFKFTYSAPTENERREIEAIRNQYSSAETATSGEDKLTKLRRLNKRVNLPPMIFAYCFGVIALLVFGLGMTMVLQWTLYVWGSVVGAFGVALMCITYPIYKAILKRNKMKYGQEIIDLSNELLNQNNQ